MTTAKDRSVLKAPSVSIATTLLSRSTLCDVTSTGVIVTEETSQTTSLELGWLETDTRRSST